MIILNSCSNPRFSVFIIIHYLAKKKKKKKPCLLVKKKHYHVTSKLYQSLSWFSSGWLLMEMERWRLIEKRSNLIVFVLLVKAF